MRNKHRRVRGRKQKRIRGHHSGKTVVVADKYICKLLVGHRRQESFGNLGSGARAHHLRTSPSRTLLGNQQTAGYLGMPGKRH